MNNTAFDKDQLKLRGLTLAPPQVLGGVRLVPLLRDKIQEDLRLVKRSYGEDLNVVQLDKKTAYYSYVPHALVATWSSDGSPAAIFGTQVKKHKPSRTSDGRVFDAGFMTARVMTKVRAREDKHRLRFLPMDMAMEGVLGLNFGGPDIAWEEYSRTALREGLGCRFETTIAGRFIVGLEDALRVFEIHPNQVGMLVFVADTLASAFVVPHPEDYRTLHRTLITDFYGELIWQYSNSAVESVYHPEDISSENVNSLSDLRRELDRWRSQWSAMHALMTTGIFEKPIQRQLVYKMGPFRMQRFTTDLDPKSENHIGELIVRADGALEYLKTYRLSAAQCRRAYLLQQLAENNWELEACAKQFNGTKNQLIFRLEKAGFGYLLHQHVLDAARKSRRQ